MNAYFKEDALSYYLDQSMTDTPCRVRFAGEKHLISLSKWNGETSMSFGVGSEHTGRLEVCRNEILLKPDATRKTHYVFRKLDGDRFEYDVILLKEPETNVIDIELDFPDGLEFFKQPSSEDIQAKKVWCSPDVIDSYAVYWKNRNGKYRTGKFCHIFRPLIYDARGRKVWGKLFLKGKILTLTIPEGWLSDASYPVVVDPVIGTQTRGATKDYFPHNGEEGIYFYVEGKMALNRFTASSEIAGMCTSYIYTEDTNPSAQGQAAVFSGTDSVPISRLSRNENVVSLTRAIPAWVPSTFTLSRNIISGETFWYGYNTQDIFSTYLDYTNTLKLMDTQEYPSVPDTFSEDFSYPILMSMYFTYTDIQHLTRTILDTTGMSDTLARKIALHRKCTEVTDISEMTYSKRALLRECLSSIELTDRLKFTQVLIRFCKSSLMIMEKTVRSIGIVRKVRSFCGFIEQLFERVLLKKEELIFVSRVTREIEFKGYLL